MFRDLVDRIIVEEKSTIHEFTRNNQKANLGLHGALFAAESRAVEFQIKNTRTAYFIDHCTYCR
jgi:hypothetical protein